MPGWEEFNRRKAEDARTGIMGQKAIIPRLVQWLVGQGVPEEQAIASIQQASQPEQVPQVQPGFSPLPGDQANLELTPLEKLARYLVGDPKPGIDRSQYATGEHIPGVDPLTDRVAVMRQKLMEQNPIATAPPRPPWIDEKLAQLQSPPDQSVRQAMGMSDAGIASTPKGIPTVHQPSPGRVQPLQQNPEVPLPRLEAPVGLEEQQANYLRDYVSQLDPETVARIRAQAAMKGNAGSLSGRGGSMEEEDARTAQNMQGPRPLGGGFSDAGAATPEYNQRLREREDFINEQYNRDAAFMIENAERKGKRIPAEGAEVLRRTAADKAEQRKIDSINALYQAGSGPSGKISPEKAQQIFQLSGQMPPASIVGAGREDANDLVRQHAASINAQRVRLESDILTAEGTSSDSYSNEMRKMIREKGDVLSKMQAKLSKKNVDYQQVVDELTAAMSKIDLKYAMSEQQSTPVVVQTGTPGSTEGVALDEKGNPIRRSGR